MQKAILILSIEESLSRKRMDNFLSQIHSRYAPRHEPYDDDDDMGEYDLHKITAQMKVYVHFDILFLHNVKQLIFGEQEILMI
jgi:hypothetical protein